MPALTRRAVLVLVVAAAAATAGCARRPARSVPDAIALHPGETPQLRALINTYADAYDVPRSLFHRVIQRESSYNPAARNGPYYGLMQILPQTARTMGYRGRPSGLLDAETNLKYAGRYLRGAWIVANGDESAAVGWYARGYYYEAKRRGLLVETGLRPA